MELILDGNVKEVLGSYEGNYSVIDNDFVNGYPVWIQQDGNNAIWFDDPSYYPAWNIGNKELIGNGIGLIFGPVGNDFWPTQIPHGYIYWDGTGWQYTDVIFKDSESMKSLISNFISIYFYIIQFQIHFQT